MVRTKVSETLDTSSNLVGDAKYPRKKAVNLPFFYSYILIGIVPKKFFSCF